MNANYLVTNGLVMVPVYGCATDETAKAMLTGLSGGLNAKQADFNPFNGQLEVVADAQLDANARGSFLLTQAAARQMIAQGGRGKIVNVASISGKFGNVRHLHYGATKAAVIQFSRVLAVQYAKQGIRVNTVVPGQLHTPMVEVRLAGQRAGGDVEKLLEQRQARIPLPFMGDGRDTANAALYLASEEARFITGTEIVVDGGMSVRCG